MKHLCPQWDYLEIDDQSIEMTVCTCKERYMNNNENKDGKKFNPTLSRGYTMKKGFWSPIITSEEYDTIMKSVEIGGRLVYKHNANKKSDKSPDGYFEFIPKEQVAAMEAARKSRSNSEDI